jgi:hypothetical protein
VTTPGKLQVASDGRITGPAAITCNNPFPCVNGSYGAGAMRGVVMHTMVGNLPGTISVFNNSSYQASAHFGVAQDGSIHQFGPAGKGWIAWAQEAGNDAWYSIEHADDGNTENPLTPAQITASAQLLEVLSRFAGFPLEVTDSPAGRGYGTHVMGGAAWGGHTCPGPGPRAGQRAQIVALAMAIRTPPAPPPLEVSMVLLTIDKATVPKGTPWPGIFLVSGPNAMEHLPDMATVAAWQALGVPEKVRPYADWLLLGGTPA